MASRTEPARARRAVSLGLTVGLALAVWGGAAFAAPSASPSRVPLPSPPAVEAPATPAVHRLPILRAQRPAWMGDSGRLALLANRKAGDPADVLVWLPNLNQLGSATVGTAVRHGLAAAVDGRLAYAERDVRPRSTGRRGPAGLKGGPDRLVVYDMDLGERHTVFEGGTILPDTIAWSPDATRLAFLALGADDEPRLALLESGRPLIVTRVEGSRALALLKLEGLIGWVNEREVLLQAAPRMPGSKPVFLAVGRDGIRSMPGGQAPCLSPDGRLLLVKASPTGGILLRGMLGGGRLLHGSATAFAWTARSDRLLAAIGGDLMVLDLEGRVQRFFPSLTAAPIDQLCASPDGRYVAFGANHALAVLEL